MADGLIHQHARLFARPVRAQQGHEGFLALARILAQRLARGFLVALMVEQVVGDLEGQADVAGISAQMLAPFGGTRPSTAPISTEAASRAPVLSCCKRVTV
jgi:hypothetical protein